MRIEDRDQGLEMKCIYCSKIYPELKDKGCPVCNGKNYIFQAAQMMDVNSFERAIFKHLSEFLQNYYNNKLDEDYPENKLEAIKNIAFNAKNDAISLVKKLNIYSN